MANSSNDFTQTVATALNIDPKDVSGKTEGFTVAEMTDLVNAATDGDNAKIAELFAAKNDDGSVNPLLDDPSNTNTAQPTTAPSATPTPTPAQPTAQTNEEAPAVPDEATYSIGDRVMVGDKEATIKNPHGPNGSIICLIDGAARPVKKGSVRPVAESVLGAADLDALLRLQTLAGMQPSVATMPFQTARIRTTEVPAEPVTQAQPIAIATNFGDEDEEPLDAITAAFAEIKDKLPELKQRDVKVVRQLQDDVLNALNESKGKFDFLKSLSTPRHLRTCSEASIVESVRAMGFARKDAETMVENYLNILGTNENGDFENMVVKSAVASLNSKRRN